MPSKVSNGAQGVTPVYVEVKPRDAAPRTPSPSSPKAVRFAPSSAQEVSRPCNNTEEWSLWHFEHHAASCRACYDPYHRVYKGRSRLCPEGHAFAQDVAINLRYRDGDVYAQRRENHKLARVEIKPGYHHVLGLLKSMEYHLGKQTAASSGSGRRHHPVVSYDTKEPTSTRYPREQYRSEKRNDRGDRREKETVIIEPATSLPKRHASTRESRKPAEPSRQNSKRYDTVVFNNNNNDEDDEEERSAAASPRTKYKERRGSLYDAEMARLEREKRYRVEVREPEGSSSRRRREREEGRRGRGERYD